MMQQESHSQKAFLDPDAPREERKENFVHVLKEIKETDANDIAVRTLQILQYTWRHGLVILLLLLPALLLIGMDQGADLIKNMLHPSTEGFSLHYFFRAIWFFGVVVLSSYAVWAIPQFYLKREKATQEKFDTQHSDKTASTEEDKPLLSQSSHFLRIIGVAPFAVYGIAFIVGARILNFNLLGYTSVNLLVAGVILAVFLLWLYSLKSLKSNLYILIGSLVVLPFLTTLAFTHFQPSVEIAYAVLGNSLFFLMLLVYGIYWRWERKFQELADEDARQRLSDIGSRLYRIVGYVTAIKILILVLFPNTMHMAAIPVLVFFSGAYILFVNHLSYRFKVLSPRWKAWSIVGLLVLVFYIYQIPSYTHFVYVTSAEDVQPRPTLEAYTEQWFMDRLADIESDSINPYIVYLVAGEGGGSRAGYWTSRMLALLDSVSDFHFSERVFALSTVSGSSVGSATWVKWLQYARDLEYSLEEKRRIAPALAENVFQANFVTGSVINLFMTDVFRAFIPTKRRSGRNVRLQREENTAFLYALGGTPLQLKDTYKRLYRDERIVHVKGRDLLNYHFLPIQAMYVDSVGTPLTQLPLTFFNTTQMSTGRKGIVSPVSLPADFSDLCIDVIDSMDTCSDRMRGKTIAFGTGNNLSELFPIFSAFTHIDGIGNFMDGGGFENKGLSTTLELYEYLQKFLAEHELTEKVQIVVLALENGGTDNSIMLEKEVRPMHQLASIASQASAQPFKSTTEKAKRRIQRVMPEGRCLFVSLSDFTRRYEHQRLKVEVSETLPLARDLSDYSIKVMHGASYKALADLWPKLIKIDTILKEDL